MSHQILISGGHWQPGGGSCRGSDLAGVGRSAGFFLVLAPGYFLGGVCLLELMTLSLLSYCQELGRASP